MQQNVKNGERSQTQISVNVSLENLLLSRFINFFILRQEYLKSVHNNCSSSFACFLDWIADIKPYLNNDETDTSNTKETDLENFQNFQKRLKEVGLDYDNEDYDASSKEEDEK